MGRSVANETHTRESYYLASQQSRTTIEGGKRGGGGGGGGTGKGTGTGTGWGGRGTGRGGKVLHP